MNSGIELSALNEEFTYIYTPDETGVNTFGAEHNLWDHAYFGEVMNTIIPELANQESTANERATTDKDFGLVNYMKLNFDLEKDAKSYFSESKDYSENEKRKFLGIINSKIKKGFVMDKKDCMKRYFEKKKRRKYVCQVKYKIRQDLACKRLRVKGKFIKAAKMDLAMAASLILTSILNRRSKRVHL